MVAHAVARIRLDDLRALPEWADAALSLQPVVAERAERYRFMERTVVIGRGLNYSNAQEFALKMMETCYVVAEGFSSADFLHGPIAMVEPSLPLFLFAPCGATWAGTEDVLSRLGQLKAETLLITDTSNPAAAAHDRALVIPARLGRKRRAEKWAAPEELYTPIPYIIPAQLFAAALASGERAQSRPAADSE